MALSEDDIYRTSTQFRLWTFTPTALSTLRKTTNASAASRVRAAIARTSPSTHPQIDCLTPTEELALLSHYTSQLLATADALTLPTPVKATAAQYLKRFYLSNSPMTYHPKSLFPACLFLATKTENHYISLERFAEKLNALVGPKKKVAPEDVVAPEFVLTQGLRFTFEVRQPGRGLRGALMELLAMAAGEAAVLHGLGKTSGQVQEEMLALPPAAREDNEHAETEASGPGRMTVKQLQDRCGGAHDAAREILSTTALLTDAYLLYTPPQIWLAALMLADAPLTGFYLSTKFPSPSSPVHARLMPVLRTCAEMLGEPPRSEREELVRIDKKLYQCQNPEKRDMVGLNAAQKRNGGEGGEESKVKKRKVERERGEREGDVFGGALGGD